MSADHKLLLPLYFQLYPGSGSQAGVVPRILALCDDTFKPEIPDGLRHLFRRSLRESCVTSHISATRHCAYVTPRCLRLTPQFLDHAAECGHLITQVRDC